jgi:ATP-dependent DNA ligase
MGRMDLKTTGSAGHHDHPCWFGARHEHRETEGEAYYRRACRSGWEGVIAKDGDSVYVSRRTRDWLKFKCSKEQEFVIGGYTEPRANRIGFGALLLGYYRGRKLIYAGKVGTGLRN